MAGETSPVVSYPYLRNVLGMEVDDESMKSVPHARGELYTHVVLKTAQAGSILGAIIGAGVAAVRKTGPISRSLMNGSRNGMLIGAPLGVLATYGAMRSTSKKPDVDMDYEYFDRAYRLRHNRGQVRVDRASIIVSGVGVATAVAQGSSVLGGGALGLAAGTLLGAVYNATIKSQ